LKNEEKNTYDLGYREKSNVPLNKLEGIKQVTFQRFFSTPTERLNAINENTKMMSKDLVPYCVDLGLTTKLM